MAETAELPETSATATAMSAYAETDAHTCKSHAANCKGTGAASGNPSARSDAAETTVPTATAAAVTQSVTAHAANA